MNVVIMQLLYIVDGVLYVELERLIYVIIPVIIVIIILLLMIY